MKTSIPFGFVCKRCGVQVLHFMSSIEEMECCLECTFLESIKDDVARRSTEEFLHRIHNHVSEEPNVQTATVLVSIDKEVGGPVTRFRLFNAASNETHGKHMRLLADEAVDQIAATLRRLHPGCRIEIE